MLDRTGTGIDYALGLPTDISRFKFTPANPDLIGEANLPENRNFLVCPNPAMDPGGFSSRRLTTGRQALNLLIRSAVLACDPGKLERTQPKMYTELRQSLPLRP
jgi:hypothetical protein